MRRRRAEMLRRLAEELKQLPQAKSKIEVRDEAGDSVLWLREVQGLLTSHLDSALTLRYSGLTDSVRQVIAASPDLKRRSEGVKPEHTVLFEVLSLDKGAPLGRVLFDTGGVVTPTSAHVACLTLFLEDSTGRTLAYSLDSGDRTGEQFGRVLAIDAPHGRAGLQNEPGKVSIVDDAMRTVAEFVFPGNVVYAGFDGDGKRFFCLTGKQDVYIEDVP